MRKLFIPLSILASTLLLGNIQDVELVAKSANKNGDMIEASGDVLVYSQTYLITADKANYNTTSGDLELFGNINILRGSEEMSRSEYAFLNMKEDLGDFSPFFLYNQSSGLWIRCGDASANPSYYITKDAVVSSCNVEDPDWKIGFTTGELNRESSFLHLYNSVFYIKDFPVFYLPYFAFPTDNTRRTGLLIPNFSYSKDEGFVYEQPIYIAPSQWWDLEIDPQIRTRRGGGLYSTLRFVDSQYSTGHISAGGFRDTSSYVTREDLRNNKHYGYEFFYDRSRIIGSGLEENGLEDGLRVDYKYLNDIDYYNLKNDGINYYDRMVTSRLNYYLRSEDHYIGVYSKYFIDTDSSNNDDTLQELPTMQYHKFLDSFLVNNIQYSVDAQYHNYYRKTGATAQQFELTAPITFYTSFFDEALRFSVSENIYLMRVNYKDYMSSGISEDYGQYVRNYHKFSLYTDLAKPYENFFHKIYFGADYIVPSYEKKKGYLDRSDFAQINTEEKQVAFTFKQYFYDTDGKKRVVHSVKQPYYFDRMDEKYGPIENKLKLFLTPNLSMSSEIEYSHKKGDIEKSISYINYENDKNNFAFSHNYNKEEDNNFLSASYERKIFKNESVFASIDYDFDEKFTKGWSIGFKQARKCWDYTIMYRENVTPKLDSSGRASSVGKKGIFLMFNLYPIGGAKYEFATESTTDL
ncbi:MAG: LPS-assembly protein LptD [Campylobacteraceae bacterium]